MRRHVGTREHQLLAFAINQRHRGTDVLARCGALGDIHDRDTGQTRKFVGLSANRHALIHATKLHRTGDLCDDGMSMRIPVSDNIAR